MGATNFSSIQKCLTGSGAPHQLSKVMNQEFGHVSFPAAVMWNFTQSLFGLMLNPTEKGGTSLASKQYGNKSAASVAQRVCERREVMNDESKEQLRERLLGDEEARAAISQRAYEIYQQRGGEPGLELDDWLQAEKEILAVMVEKEMRRSAELPAASDSQAGTLASSDEEESEDLPSKAPTTSLTLPTAEAEKSRPRPPAAKKSKSRTASKSSAPRKKKTKPEETAATEEKAPKKGARLIKRSKPANGQPT